VRRVADVPLREVSGVCLRRGAGGRLSLVAIGDRVALAAWVRLPRDDDGVLEWRTVDIPRLVDPAAARVVASVALEIEGRGELARSWSDPRKAWRSRRAAEP
jgi:hypothetical protein